MDVAAQVLALLVCVMRVLGANEAERAADGIKQLPRYGCFFVLRFETDLCDGGVRAVLSLLRRLGWSADDAFAKDAARTQHMAHCSWLRAARSARTLRSRR